MRVLLFSGLFVAATAFLLGACAGEEEASSGTAPSPQSSPTAPSIAPSPQSIPSAPAGGSAAFETIGAGDQSGMSGGQLQLLKLDTQAKWEEFWSRHQSVVTPQPDVPAVDFSQEMVIAVVDKQESSGGFGIEITDIEGDGGRLLVRVSKQVPGPDCIVTAVITQPFHIVRTAASDLEPDLLITEEIYSCG